MAGSPRYVVSQDVPLPLRLQPARTVQMVPDAVPLPTVRPVAMTGEHSAAVVDPTGAAHAVVAAAPGAASALFPTLSATRASLAGEIAKNIQAGEYGKVAGNVLRGAVAYPAAAVNDVVVNPVLRADRAADKAGASIINGLLGTNLGNGSTSDTDAIKGAVKATAPKQVDPVTAAMMQGRAASEAAPAIATPQDQLGAAIMSVLGHNPSIADIQAVGGLIPAAVKPQQTNKDAIFGSTAQLSQQIYAAQVADAQKLAETDPIGAKAAVSKAIEGYYNRNAGLVGSDPSKLAMAQLLNPDKDQ